ncbi:DUF3606 domain-containing protein [Sphingobacterium alkalisoli]|uniref:DUF3606 domain-containing protein n=1 Tax=Sphingobacterium alkalisoli TaxID=1874115 RepID=A0A4U0H5X6_9SPHI|nr:DUF3606 domain-containing protein [Sphingobacterium alkalisoli]
MADNKEKNGKSDRNKVSGSENYEIQYFKDKLGVSSQHDSLCKEGGS